MNYYLSIHRRIGDPRGNSLCLSARFENYEQVLKRVAKYFELVVAQEELNDAGQIIHAVWSTPLPDKVNEITFASVVRSKFPLDSSSKEEQLHFFAQYKLKKHSLEKSKKLTEYIHLYKKGEKENAMANLFHLFATQGWSADFLAERIESLPNAKPCPSLAENGILKGFAWMPERNMFGYQTLLGNRLRDTDIIDHEAHERALNGEERAIFAVTGINNRQFLNGIFGSLQDCAEWCERWSNVVPNFETRKLPF